MMVRFFLALCVLTACARHEYECHAHEPGATTEHERPALSFTDWTQHTELFMELRALVRGKESACAAHVTQLEGFKALANGKLTVILRGSTGEERFTVDKPTVPGIFRPIARPANAGKRQLLVEIQANGIQAQHDLGEVEIFENVAHAKRAIPEEAEPGGRITFLKEQQWPIVFSTALAAERDMRTALAVPGQLVLRPEANVIVSAPVAGRVVSQGPRFARIGDRVTIQQSLGVLAPRLDAADLASLELAIQSGELDLTHAQAERARLEDLRSEGAVPERRVTEAMHQEATAKAALESARRRFEQFRRVQTTAGKGPGAVPLLAPLSGVVEEVFVAPGSFVAAGAPLFRVIDTTSLWLEARVAELDASIMQDVQGAWFTQGTHSLVTELSADRLVAKRRSLDARTRTLSIWFLVDNADARFTPGAYASVWLVTGEASRALAVPEAAIIDDGGTPVVFVQVEGEAFERRIVRLGRKEAGFVAIETGVKAGERVAVDGAYAVKLAASSGTLPAHGHSH
jgi:RND family efflux transporter MFP subunit